MSYIQGIQFTEFFAAYTKAMQDNPDANDQQHEIATFTNAMKLALPHYSELEALSDETAQRQLRDFGWLMWKYGFSYDYPEDDDFKEAGINWQEDE